MSSKSFAGPNCSVNVFPIGTERIIATKLYSGLKRLVFVFKQSLPVICRQRRQMRFILYDKKQAN